MEVGAIGGGMAMGAATGITGGAAATGPASAGPASPGTASPGSETQSLIGTFLQGTVPAGIESLVETLKDFTSAEILFALILLSAMSKDDDDDKKSGGGAALGFLAGLALAGQISQSAGQTPSAPVQGIQTGGATGGTINLSA